MDLTATRGVASRLEVLPAIGSTNTELSERAADAREWPHLSVLLTDTQTAGRARLDRSWTAPPGSSLAVSVLLRRLPADPDARAWIPLAAGLAMSEAIAEQLPEHRVAVKWPNDVLVEGRKICGILAQATSDAVIVGTGVNTAMTAAELPVPTATSFAALGVRADADRLLSVYLRQLDMRISDLAEAGDAVAGGLHAAVSARCATIGLDVRVTLPGERVLVGTAVAVDQAGRLVVLSAGEHVAVSAGDVVHVRPARV
ncbi:biotin--[acetyl-CoA-carboxylase] ligase [Microbacterium sp. NPDC097977]|uniref:biotin--[acetyl-CoA-carboxylase] ligase n=1 Tax=Microbacterium sp. NPDC097977 TaxID=3155686 RepID=UPI00332B9FB3